MAKNDPYHPDYRHLYPGIEDCPEILTVLKKSDRKMEYMEVDLKTERFLQDQAAGTTAFLPSREDSVDRLIDEEQMQFTTDELTPEEILLHNEEIHLLRAALAKLSPADAKLICALFYEGLSERQFSQQTGIPFMTIHNRKVRILKTLRKLLMT